MAEPAPEPETRLADFTMDGRMLTLSLMALAVGVIGGLVSKMLVVFIDLVTNLFYYQRLSIAAASPIGNPLGLLAVLVPVAGGLLTGLLARYGSEKIRGDGIPEALEAILFSGARIQPKVALLKPISSAIAIGTGGPFGAEGPIIMTGGAFGSLFAQLFQLTAVERRILLAAGAAAGMAAIFGAPVAAVLFAIELFLFEWKPRSFIPVAVASMTAGALRVPLLGPGPIFGVAAHPALPAAALIGALALGLVAGVFSAVVTQMVYGFDTIFERLPVHWMWWPAMGGIAVGIGGIFYPHVLGVGYDVIRSLLNGELIGGVVLGLLITKALVWSISLGSGASGGVFAPLFIIGGALGALAAPLIPVGDVGLWVLVGMAATLCGALRSPFGTAVFALEVTHDLNALPAVLVGCLAAEAVTLVLMRRSIVTAKVARRGLHVAYDYGVDPLDTARVGEVMDQNVVSISAAMTVAELAAAIGRGDSALAQRQGTPIVDAAGRLAGIITRGDVLRAMETPAGLRSAGAPGRQP